MSSRPFKIPKIRKTLTQEEPVTIRNRSVPNPVKRQQGSKVIIPFNSVSKPVIKRPAEPVQPATTTKKIQASNDSTSLVVDTIPLPPDNLLMTPPAINPPPAINSMAPPPPPINDPIPPLVKVTTLGTKGLAVVTIGTGKHQCWRCKCNFETAGQAMFHENSKECYDIQHYTSTLKVDHMVIRRNEPFSSSS